MLAPLAVAFVYAPLAFGATTPWTQWVLDWLLVHGFLLWLCVLVLERRWPRLPLGALLPLVLLILLGIGQVLNPRSVYDPVFADFEANEGYLRGLPGSVDAATTGPLLLHFGVLLLAGVALRDALAGSRVRWLLLRAISLAGLLVAVAGMYQKATGAEAMLWNTTFWPPDNRFFAAFRYHANAASFLNLTWPAALVVWLRGRLMRPGSIVNSLDLCVFLLVFAAVFVNSSKAGQIVGLLGMALAVWHFRKELLIPVTSRAGAMVLGGFLSLLAAALVLPGAYATIANWSSLVEDGSTVQGRLLAYRACLVAVGEVGFFGSGAGTFRYVFPFYTQGLGEELLGFWHHAHQDWLQGIIEWGWLGFAAWAGLFGGAFLHLWLRIREARRQNRPELGASASALALGLVLLHGLVDFPLQIPSIQWLVVFYLALAWSDPHGNRRNGGNHEIAG